MFALECVNYEVGNGEGGERYDEANNGIQNGAFGSLDFGGVADGYHIEDAPDNNDDGGNNTNPEVDGI